MMKTGEAREQLLAGIHRRAALLARITAPDHSGRDVDNVLAMISGHLLESCLVLLGETFEQEWASRIFDHTAEGHGICRFCHSGRLDVEKGMCLSCWTTAEADDEEAELDDIFNSISDDAKGES